MSATQPASTTELKEYCLRKLGKPVIDVNLADEQMDDIIQESIQFFQEYHFDGTEVFYAKEQVAPSTLTFASAASGTFTAEETITGGTSNATAKIHDVTSTTVLKFKEHSQLILERPPCFSVKINHFVYSRHSWIEVWRS